MSAVVTRVCPHCQGTGGVAHRAMVKVKEALRADAIPAAFDTVYENKKNGRWPWLTRVGPSGRQGRDLWVMVDDAIAWWIADGRPTVAARLLSLAKESGGR